MKNKNEEILFIWCNMLYKTCAQSLLRKLKNKEELDNEDKRIIKIILEDLIRGKNE